MGESMTKDQLINFLTTYDEDFRNWALFLGTFVGIVLFIWRNIIFDRVTTASEDQTRISVKTADDKAFLDAVRVFESVNADSRIGAIMALERIAIQNPDYKKQIFKIFFGFVRNNSNEGKKDDDSFYVRPDILEVMEILKRNPFEKRDNEFSLDGSCLTGFKFRVNDFKRVSFRNSNLNNTEFVRSDFSACNFARSYLANAKFVETKLSGANFYKCDLTSALFFKNEMPSCNFLHAKLIGARFEKIDKNIFESIIDSLKLAMIIYKGKPLASDEELHASYEEDFGVSDFDIFKDDFNKLVQNTEGFGHDFDTKFPEYVEVTHLDGDRFDLKISDES